MQAIRKFVWENSLSLCMFTLFGVFLVALSITGYIHNNEELQMHGGPPETYVEYVLSGEFAEAVFENWESEFLQMAALVVATIFLRQRGSADSKKLRGHEDVDTTSRYSIIHAATWKRRALALAAMLYANSLTLALVTLFIISFILHAVGGVATYNQEASQHNVPAITLVQYVASAQFWFESFQNWQSEFLAVGTLLVLSIFLRQRGSPESKPIGAPHRKTGGD